MTGEGLRVGYRGRPSGISVLLPVEIHQLAGDGTDLTIADSGVINLGHRHDAAGRGGDEHLV